MATDKKFIEAVLDKLQPLEITAKPMFGEYRPLLPRKETSALVCDNTLFVKITRGRCRESRTRQPRARPTTVQTGLSNLFGRN